MALVNMLGDRVKISFFGGIGFGHVSEPLQTRDGNLLVASLDDLMATKSKAILDRAEAKDYHDIAQNDLPWRVFIPGTGRIQKKMFKGKPSQVLRAIGYFKDGDLPALPKADCELLRNARDAIHEVPDIHVISGLIADPAGRLS